jgi:hypothetical protein
VPSFVLPFGGIGGVVVCLLLGFLHFLVLQNLKESINHVKFGSINNHSPMRGHVGHPEASQGDLENQPVL